jgi:threonine/homoserine/homoserine lactone efflux protein
MIDTATVLAYMLAVLGLFFIPGPANLLVLACASSGGRRVGIASGLGIAAGDLIHSTMATLGLSAVLMTSAVAFSVVKYVGVAYLIYLGVRAFIEPAEALALPSAPAIRAPRAFRQAVLVETLNPKTALFFLAFLPQFVHPENGRPFAQFVMLGLLFVAMSGGWTLVLAVLAGSFGRWLHRHRGLGRWRGKAVAMLYFGLGIRLAFQER